MEAYGSSRKFTEVYEVHEVLGAARKCTEVLGAPDGSDPPPLHGSSRKFGWLPSRGPLRNPSPRLFQNSSNVGHFYGNLRKKKKNHSNSRGQTSTKKFTEKQSRNVFPHDPNPVPVIQKQLKYRNPHHGVNHVDSGHHVDMA